MGKNMADGSKPPKAKDVFMAEKIERRKVADLVPDPRNSRVHSDEQISQLMAGVKEWGFTNPILIRSDNTIIAGHGRHMAAQRLGMEELPCMIADNWSEAQIRAFVIWDNKSALNSAWDFDMLKVEFQELQGFEFDLGLTGFGEDAIGNLLADEEDEFDAGHIEIEPDEEDSGLEEYKIELPPHLHEEIMLRANRDHGGVIWHCLAVALGVNKTLSGKTEEEEAAEAEAKAAAEAESESEEEEYDFEAEAAEA